MSIRHQRFAALALVVTGFATLGAASNGLAGTDGTLRAISEPPPEVRLVDCPYRDVQPAGEV